MRELSELQKRYLQQLKEEEENELKENNNLIDSFIEFSKTKNITLQKSNFRYIKTIGIIAIYPNIIVHLLSSGKDKEGLFDFDLLSKQFEKRRFANGYLYSDKFILMAHPFFRRGLRDNNGFAPRFIELFWNQGNKETTKSISLDSNRVRIDINDSTIIELDTWYGPKFTPEISKIEDGLVHLRPPTDLDEMDLELWFNSTYSLDIKWSTSKAIKTFEAEEFFIEKVSFNKDNCSMFPARYIHAEFDNQKNHFRHLDGAIHYYTKDEYTLRRDSDLNYNSKRPFKIKTKSEKLFKLNGKINITTWLELVSHFFTGDPLIHIYFDGKYPDHISALLTKL